MWREKTSFRAEADSVLILILLEEMPLSISKRRCGRKGSCLDDN